MRRKKSLYHLFHDVWLLQMRFGALDYVRRVQPPCRANGNEWFAEPIQALGYFRVRAEVPKTRLRVSLMCRRQHMGRTIH